MYLFFDPAITSLAFMRFKSLLCQYANNNINTINAIDIFTSGYDCVIILKDIPASCK